MWEAVQTNRRNLIDLLLQFGGSLAMSGMQLASVMSQQVAEGDLDLLRCTLK